MHRVSHHHFRMLPLVLLAGVAAMTAHSQPLAPDIVVTKIINAPVAEVWKAWPAVMGSLEKRFAAKG